MTSVIQIEGIKADYLESPEFITTYGAFGEATMRAMYGRGTPRYTDRFAQAMYIGQKIGHSLHERFNVHITQTMVSFVLESGTTLTLADINELTKINIAVGERVYTLTSIGAESDTTGPDYGTDQVYSTGGVHLHYSVTQ